ncbi:MAG: EamA family transporter [Pedobacter sp.]|nr:MAG: EamA family transporter [Pedobacter sp.]
MNTATPKDYLHLHFIVFLWGFTAILGQLITLPDVELVFYRTLSASLALAALIYLKKAGFKIGRNEVLKIVSVGAIIAVHWVLFFVSATVSSVSICLAGMATGTLWTAILEPLIRKRAVKPHELILGLIIVAGLYVIFRFEFDNALGLALGVASAMCGAVFSIFNSGFTKKHSPLTITFYEMLGACLTVLLFFPVYSGFFTNGKGLQLEVSLSDAGYLAVLVLVCTVYAFSASVNLMKRISAYAMNLTINLEPVYGIMLAVLIFGDKEKMSAGFYSGTLIILFAVLIYPVLDKYVEKRKARLLQKALPN